MIVPGRRMVAVAAALAMLAALTAPAAAYPRPGATERVSVTSDGAEGDGFSFRAAISADGRHVAFESAASNLVPGDTNDRRDVFVHDRETGTTERVSIASDGAEGNSHSMQPTISADGRHVAFHSGASNLVADKTTGFQDVFVHDRQTGTTERISLASDGAESDGDSLNAAISPDGRQVAFESLASNLVPDATNGAFDVYVHDRETGTTERVSVASDGTEANGSSFSPSISADGRHVAFDSVASNLVPDDTNGQRDIFVHDREDGTTERVSVASDGAEATDSVGVGSRFPAISADGRHVAFQSYAYNLVPGDANGDFDVFVHDRDAGTTERVSVASDGAEGNGRSNGPALSADGRHVTFHSWASNLVPGDTNDEEDIFVHDRETGTTERVSVASDGAEANGGSLMVAIDGDGRHVAFYSYASNLVPDDTNQVWDVFVRDRGPATGLGGLEVQQAAGGLVLSGWATFSGATLASADDPPDDGAPAAKELGAELTGANFTYRPEQEDMLLRLRLTSLPQGGRPGLLYRWSFTAGGTAYEVRAQRAVTANPPTADPYFALYECALTCTESARLSGGIGTTGAEVRVSVPLGVLGAEEGEALTDIAVSTALGEATVGALLVLDEMELPEATIPVAEVWLGIAPAGTPEEVTYITEAELVEGEFSGTVDVSSLEPGGYRVWARACLGEVCGARSVVVEL